MQSDPLLCPSQERLLALHRGELECEAVDTLCRHLEGCASCESFLATLKDGDDGIVANLRKFVGCEPRIEGAELRVLEARAKAIPLAQQQSDPLPLGKEIDWPATPAETAPLPRLGKYQLLKELGRGGMGIVYAAIHTTLKKKVAVKVILPEHSGHSQIRARFRREMEAVGELSHPNIVAATDADEAEGCQFLVMELVDGLNLDHLLRLCGPLPVAEACEIMRQGAVGLQYVFEHGRVHRDLKPSNLMVSTDGVVKILDLGLARLFGDDKGSGELTGSNVVMGTADYMAPEQWEDSRKAGIRADIYSLGCTFYKVLVGDAPFSDPEYKPAVIKKQAHARLPFPTIESRRPDVPGEVAAVLERMLAKDPGERFATPKELAEALRPFTEGSDCRRLVAGALQRSALLPQTQPENKGVARETAGNKRETPANVSIRAITNPFNRIFRNRRRWTVIGGVMAAVVALAVLGKSWFASYDSPMQPGRWYYPLRDRQPDVLFWRNEKGDHFFDHSKNSGELRVDAKDVLLFGLDETDRAAYRIVAEISQTREHGGVGLFFGYRDSFYDTDFKPCSKYQYLELIENRHPAAQGSYLLTRGFTTIDHLRQPNKFFREVGFASAKLEKAMVKEENTLDIEVKGGKLTRVLWNTELLRFSGSADADSFTDADYIGKFGTFSRKSYSVFGKVGIKLYERVFP
jgi:eukaryotic-like serine/threonine-protein kinase